MMYHHDTTKSYEEAASEAARDARAKMEKILADGKASARTLAHRIERDIPNDAIISGRLLRFGLRESVGNALPTLGVAVNTADVRLDWTVHRHALGQLTSKIGMRVAPYVSALLDSDSISDRAQAAAILNYHYGQEELAKTRHYCREVDGELRGVLSDSYQPIDARPCLQAIAAACKELGAVPVEGTATSIQVGLKAYLPMVFEPVPNEVMLVGVQWSTSDFGCGANVARLTVLRLWCTNKAVMETALRQVHIGGKIEGGEGITYSPETVIAQSKAHALKLYDTVKSLLGPAKVRALLETIKRADANKIEWKAVQTSLEKALLKKELEAVRDSFEGDDVVLLPRGRTAWRVSNAISLLAGKTEDADRRLDLERLAGVWVTGANPAPVAQAA